jgi:hypothetical protein
MDKINLMIDFIQNTQNISEALVIPLKELCDNLLSSASIDDIFLNPALGRNIPQIGKVIPSDCDLIIADILYDIKCTSGKNYIYEILQLLGYASLINCGCLRRYDEKITRVNVISTINLLNGELIKYDVSQFTDENFISYLKLLTNTS